MKEIEKIYAKIKELVNVTAAETNAKRVKFQPELMNLTLRCSAESDFTLIDGLRSKAMTTLQFNRYWSMN